MIYFTSDLHLGHNNIIKYTNRPFKDYREMDNILIDNWNKTIKDKDEVYILGDLTMGDPDIVDRYLSRMNGRKYLIRGNHDYFANIYNGNQLIWIKDYYELKHNKEYIILCHYPFNEWNRSYHGSLHLHGHQHNHSDYNLDQRKNNKNRYDVGVDANDFKPISLDKILKFFRSNG